MAFAPSDIEIRGYLDAVTEKFGQYLNTSWIDELRVYNMSVSDSSLRSTIKGALILESTDFNPPIIEITTANQSIAVNDITPTVTKADINFLSTLKYRINRYNTATAESSIASIISEKIPRDIEAALGNGLQERIIKSMIATTDTKSTTLFVPRFTEDDRTETLGFKQLLRIARYLSEIGQDPNDYTILIHAKQEEQLINNLSDGPYALGGINYANGEILSPVAGLKVVNGYNAPLPNILVTQAGEAAQDIDTITYPASGTKPDAPGCLFFKRRTPNIALGLTKFYFVETQPGETNTDPETPYVSMWLGYSVAIVEKAKTIGIFSTYPTI